MARTLRMEERIFTIEEARGLLPLLRGLLQDAGVEWRKMNELNPEIQKVRDKVPLDAFTPHGVQYIQSVTHLMMILQQVKELGVVVKDVDKGLCDFPYMRSGRIVYLCWHQGEESIGYWHDMEAGFAGREPLDETDETDR